MWDITPGSATNLSSRRHTSEECSPGTFRLQLYGGFCSQCRNPYVAEDKAYVCTTIAYLRSAVRALPAAGRVSRLERIRPCPCR